MSELSDAANWLAKRFDEIRTRGFIAEDGHWSVAILGGADMSQTFLETPGVEVREMVGNLNQHGVWMLADMHYGVPATHRRIVIMLPVEEIVDE